MNAAASRVAPTPQKRTVSRGRRPNAHYRRLEYLTGKEIERLMKAAGDNRYGHRDASMILLAFRHGLRASELCSLRWECMSSEHFGQLAWQFKRMSGSSGLKVQAAIAC